MYFTVYRVLQHFEDGTIKKIGDFKYLSQAEEYMDTHEGFFSIVEWDCD